MYKAPTMYVPGTRDIMLSKEIKKDLAIAFKELKVVYGKQNSKMAPEILVS